MRRLILILLLSLSVQGQLVFDGTRHQLVTHGTFYPTYDGSPATYLDNEFTLDIWIKIDPSMKLGYMVSTGYGGAHAILFGVQGDGRFYALTGNINSIQPNGTIKGISFNSAPVIVPNTWVQVTVELNGSTIKTYVDGALQGTDPFTGQRIASESVNDPLGGEFFVGGSDHENFTGMIGQLRLYEGQSMYSNGGAFTFVPQPSFRDEMFIAGSTLTARSNLLADYSKCGSIITDESNGYKGVRHSGALFSAMSTLSVTQRRSGLPLPQCVNDPAYQVRVTPLQPTAGIVSLSGRVITSSGTPVSRATVSATGVKAVTNALGYYKLNLTAGKTYIVTAGARRLTFTPRVVTLRDALTGFDMVGT